MKRAILYARVSTADSDNATSSIAAQLDACRAYAAQRGYRIVEEIHEEAERHTSGADWLPGLDRILRLAPGGSFDVLICRELDRLARNRFKQLSTEIELESHGVVVEYAAGQYADTPEGRLLKGLVSEFAEYEREKIRARTHGGLLRSVEQGSVNVGAMPPYGYVVETVDGKRRLTLVEETAAVVRMIFHLYVDDLYSAYQIGDYLDAHGVPLPRDGRRKKTDKWVISVIHSILSNETYAGRWYYRKTYVTKDPKTGKRRLRPRPRDEWLCIAVPAIVDDSLFEAAQARKEANRVQKGHQHAHTYALGGMARCGRCGAAMTGQTNWSRGKPFPYYGCSAHRRAKRAGASYCPAKYFRADHVDAAVWGWIKSLLLEPKTLRAAITEYQETRRERVRPQLSMLESSRARLSDLEGQKERLISAYAKGAVSLDELIAQRRPLDDQLDQLQQAIAVLAAETDPQLLTDAQIDAIETVAAEMRAGLDVADTNLEVQRKLFQLLEVQVSLIEDEGVRYADVTCNLGNSRCVVDSLIP